MPSIAKSISWDSPFKTWAFWQLLLRVGCGDCPTEGGAGSRQVRALQLGGIHDSGLLQYNNIMSYSFLSLIIQKLFPSRLDLRIRLHKPWFKILSMSTKKIKKSAIFFLFVAAESFCWQAGVCWPCQL
jgi:hypothetical protein